MPIHDLGYRGWQGHKSSSALRWWVIASSGVRIVWRNRWLRRMLLVAWLPATYVGLGFFGYEQFVERSSLDFVWPFVFGVVRNVPGAARIAQVLSEDPAGARHEVWAWLLMLFFRYPQGMLMLLVVGMIAPPLIARDVRSRAFLLYFSRPLSPLEYLLGKAMIVWFYLALITTLPALVLYVIGVLLSPSVSVTLQTWDLPLRILAASIVLMVPTTVVALLFSSLTSESRFAGFAWFMLWALGWVGFVAIRATRLEMDTHWTAISLYHTLGNAQRWIFGLQTDLAQVWFSIAILFALTAFSLIVLVRRVSAPIRV